MSTVIGLEEADLEDPERVRTATGECVAFRYYLDQLFADISAVP